MAEEGLSLCVKMAFHTKEGSQRAPKLRVLALAPMWLYRSNEHYKEEEEEEIQITQSNCTDNPPNSSPLSVPLPTPPCTPLGSTARR